MVSDASSASAAIRAASSSAATTELSRRRSGRTAGGGGISSSPASVGGHSPDAAELRRRTARSGEHCGEQARRTRARPIWRMRSSSAGYLSPTSSKSALVNRNSSAGSARRLPSGDPCASARSCICVRRCAAADQRTAFRPPRDDTGAGLPLPSAFPSPRPPSPRRHPRVSNFQTIKKKPAACPQICGARGRALPRQCNRNPLRRLVVSLRRLAAQPDARTLVGLASTLPSSRCTGPSPPWGWRSAARCVCGPTPRSGWQRAGRW